MFPQTDQIAFAGDWHGDLRFAQKALKYIEKSGTKLIIHTGDFGAWPDEKDPLSPSGYLRGLESEANRLGITIMFVDGKHEHHSWLGALPIDRDGIRRISNHIWHLPRGFRWEVNGITFLALGGAYSVNRNMLTMGVNCFEEEVIDHGDVEKAIAGGKADVMITHDAPNLVEIPHSKAHLFPKEAIEIAERHRDLLGKVVDRVQPKHLFHGHFHQRYEAIRARRGFATAIHGLDCNGGGPDLSHNIIIYKTRLLG